MAVKWYRMAAEQGHAEAKEALRKVGTKGKRRPRQAAPSHAPRSQEEWRQLGKADFPAYVKTIVFPNGNVLDANHSVTWDPWTARFGGQRAKAYRRGPHPDFGFTRIDILLTCENQITGKINCYLDLIQGGVEEGSGCFLADEKRMTCLILIVRLRYASSEGGQR